MAGTPDKDLRASASPFEPKTQNKIAGDANEQLIRNAIGNLSECFGTIEILKEIVNQLNDNQKL